MSRPGFDALGVGYRRRAASSLSNVLGLCLSLGLGACQGQGVEAGGNGVDAGAEDDPLAIVSTPPQGSLDHLYQRVLHKSCAGQPGLCHAGQFEPNLSTPALAYANLVYTPSLEKFRVARVVPGDPGASLLISKLRGVNVSTRMPLGAAPLPEEDIGLFEAWIRAGALRRPGAAPAERLNNPPLPPEIGVFDSGGRRLDGAGQFTVAAGTPLTFRHTVRDFETADADIPYGLFLLQTPDGRDVILSPGAQAPQVGLAHYDPAGPMGVSGVLDWRYDFTIPATVTLLDARGATTSEPASGKALSVIAIYVDSLPVSQGITTFAIRQGLILVK